MAPRLRCATRERRVRGRPAPGRAPPRPAGLNSRLVCRDWRRRRACRGRRLPAFRGRRFPCTGVTVAVLHSGDRLLRTTVYVNSIFAIADGIRRFPRQRNIALFMRARPGDVPVRPLGPASPRGRRPSPKRAMFRSWPARPRLQMNRAMFRSWAGPSRLPRNGAMFLPVRVVLRRVDPPDDVARRSGGSRMRPPGRVVDRDLRRCGHGARRVVHALYTRPKMRSLRS